MNYLMTSTLIFKCLYLENGNLKEKDILVLPLDLTDRSSHEAATKVVLQEFGKVRSHFESISLALTQPQKRFPSLCDH